MHNTRESPYTCCLLLPPATPIYEERPNKQRVDFIYLFTELFLNRVVQLWVQTFSPFWNSLVFITLSCDYVVFSSREKKLNGIGVTPLLSLRVWAVVPCVSVSSVVGWFGFGRIVGWLLPPRVGAYIKEVRARLKNSTPVDPVRSSESDVLPASSRPPTVNSCVKLSCGWIIESDNIKKKKI